MSREHLEAPAGLTGEPAQNVSGNSGGAGRKKRHVNAAARVAAFRATHARLDIVTTPGIADTIERIAADLGASRNEVVNSLLRFALTNRNWRQQGLWGGKAAEQ